MMADEDYSQGPASGESPEAQLPETGERRRAGAPASSVFADLDTERAVVAALLIEPSCIATVLSVLGGLSAAETAAAQKKKNNDIDALKKSTFHSQAFLIFYDAKLATVYEAILELTEKNIGIDLLSVSDHLERNAKLEAVGGQEYLLDVQSSIVSTANVESWCHTLRDYAMLREMIRRTGRDILIEVDGGVKRENAGSVIDAGADVLVMGTGLFRAQDPQSVVRDVLSHANRAGEASCAR